MFEPLLGRDGKGAIQPRLAESVEISKDGKLYTFHLRKGVKFHNGKEMMADDIKFAIDYTLNPKNGAYGLADLDAVEKVEAIDKYTLRISLKKINPLFLTVLTDIRAFSVIPKESLPEGMRKPSTFPPGTGPFKFVEWRPGQRVVFERLTTTGEKKPTWIGSSCARSETQPCVSPRCKRETSTSLNARPMNGCSRSFREKSKGSATPEPR